MSWLVYGIVVVSGRTNYYLANYGKLDAGFYSATVFINTVTDYVSLFLIRRCLTSFGSWPVRALLFGACIGADVVGIGVFIRALLIGIVVVGPSSFDFGYLSFFTKASLLAAVPAALVFSWLPLFAVGIVVIRLLSPLSWLVTQLQWAIKSCEGRPLKAIGYVAGAIVLAVMAVLQFIIK
jgi:hypothetical protein